MPDPFLDTNVILRHLLVDHSDHSPRASAFLRRVERGEVSVHTSEIVVFEAVFTLERSYRHPREKIRDGVLSLINLPSVRLPRKRLLRRTFDLYVDYNVSFADAYHVALTQELGLDEVLSFDRDFDRIPGIRRIEP